jgi:predicted GNAT family acetyltransferase
MSADLEVKHGETGHRGSFYIEREGDRVAEQTYSMLPDGKTVIIDHTEVAESLRGQDIARRLTLVAVEWARGSGVKIIPLCPFAKAVFDRDPAIRDVLQSAVSSSS